MQNAPAPQREQHPVGLVSLLWWILIAGKLDFGPQGQSFIVRCLGHVGVVLQNVYIFVIHCVWWKKNLSKNSNLMKKVAVSVSNPYWFEFPICIIIILCERKSIGNYSCLIIYSTIQIALHEKFIFKPDCFGRTYVIFKNLTRMYKDKI